MLIPSESEFSHIVVIGNLPAHFTFQVFDAELHTCTC
jgi:hypothetical protein